MCKKTKGCKNPVFDSLDDYWILFFIFSLSNILINLSSEKVLYNYHNIANLNTKRNAFTHTHKDKYVTFENLTLVSISYTQNFMYVFMDVCMAVRLFIRL